MPVHWTAVGAAVGLVAAVLAVLGVAGCDARQAAPSAPSDVTGYSDSVARPPANVVLVTLDTTRADHLGCYGSEQAATPVLDALARRGTLFERVWAPTPLTLPSHATILTGLPAAGHGVRNNGTYRLPDEAESIAEILQAAGFATGAFVSAFVLDRRFGLGQGFDHYDDDLTVGNPVVSSLEIRSLRPREPSMRQPTGSTASPAGPSSSGSTSTIHINRIASPVSSHGVLQLIPTTARSPESIARSAGCWPISTRRDTTTTRRSSSPPTMARVSGSTGRTRTACSCTTARCGFR